MKLDEIIGGEKVRRSDELFVKHRTPGRKPSSPSMKRLGAGVQGVAVERSKKTNVVTKIFGLNSESDGYYQFLLFCKKHPNNPYLPKISKLRVYEKPFTIDLDGFINQYEKTGIVGMERLIPVRHPKIKDAVRPQLERLGVPKHEARKTTDYMVSRYKTAIENKSIERDEQFEQAIEFLKDYSSDLHSGNVMVRLTSSGPQLVLIDPVWEPS